MSTSFSVFDKDVPHCPNCSHYCLLFCSFADLFFQSSKDVSFHNTHIELLELTSAFEVIQLFYSLLAEFTFQSKICMWGSCFISSRKCVKVVNIF